MYYTDCYLTCNSSGDFYLSDFLGTPGTSQYNSRRWRIATVDYFTERELNDNFSIATLRVDYNSSGAPSITKSPNTAIFSDASDFTYTGYDSSFFAYNEVSGSFTCVQDTIKQYSFEVIATHKVTNRIKRFVIVANPQLARLIGVPDYEGTANHLHGNNFSGELAPALVACGYSDATAYISEFTADYITSLMDGDNSGFFLSRSHGTQRKNSSGIQIGTGLLLTDPVNENDGVYLYSNDIPSSINLSNMKLMAFVACHTGDGGSSGPNLPSAVVARGAETAIGFTDTVNCDKADAWSKQFTELLSEGYSVGDACEYLSTINDFISTPFASPVICGNSNLVLIEK